MMTDLSEKGKRKRPDNFLCPVFSKKLTKLNLPDALAITSFNPQIVVNAEHAENFFSGNSG